jgi:phage baseplate assembly protein W
MIKIAPVFPLVLNENGSYEMHGSSEEDVKKVINQNIKNILLTNPGEKLFDANFGVGVSRYLFEPAATVESGQSLPPITSNITDQLASYIPYVEVNEVSVNTENDKLSIRIQYTILQSLDQPIVAFNLNLPFNI